MSHTHGLRARIAGVVQGVGFRYTTVQHARRLGLTGYVRNNMDGSVDVVAEGETEDLDRLLSWLRKGPSGAYVRSVETQRLPATGTYDGFNVRH